MKPTVKWFVYRLEKMLVKVGNEECMTFCPGLNGFHVGGKITYASAGLDRDLRWCGICREFMGSIIHCPCVFYKNKDIDPKAEAWKRIKAWRKKHDN